MKDYYSIWTCRVSGDHADDYSTETCLLGGEFTIEELKREIPAAKFRTLEEDAFWILNETTNQIVPRSVWE